MLENTKVYTVQILLAKYAVDDGITRLSMSYHNSIELQRIAASQRANTCVNYKIVSTNYIL